MTKKEFKKKCKMEKTKSYKYTIWGTILAAVGLIVALASMLFLIDDLPKLLVYNGVAVSLAILGITFDVYGKIMMSREYKEQSK